MPVVPAAIACACTVPSISRRAHEKRDSGFNPEGLDDAFEEAIESLNELHKCYEDIEDSLDEILKRFDKLEEDHLNE